MSSYIVGWDTMHAIGSALADRSVLAAACRAYDIPVSTKARKAVLERWAKANLRAVKSRYEDKVSDETAPTVPRNLAGSPDDRREWLRALKALDCLSYQCSEEVSEDAADVHRVDLFSMECAKAEIAHAVLHNDPDYEAAPWG
jgi:hypothetical protein